MMPPGLTTTATHERSSRMVRKVKSQMNILEPGMMTHPAMNTIKKHSGGFGSIGMQAMQRQAKFAKRRKI